MASLVRLGAIRILKNSLVTPTRSALISRAINTSKSTQVNTDTSTCSNDLTKKPNDISTNWVSWGWNEEDKFLDRLTAHATFFVFVTVCLVAGGYSIAYLPDPHFQEWSQREAYLQLRYREEHGLPPIDRNYHDLATLQIPTDEELGDEEIII